MRIEDTAEYYAKYSAALKFFWTCVALKLVDDDYVDDDDSLDLQAAQKRK